MQEPLERDSGKMAFDAIYAGALDNYVVEWQVVRRADVTKLSSTRPKQWLFTYWNASRKRAIALLGNKNNQTSSAAQLFDSMQQGLRLMQTAGLPGGVLAHLQLKVTN